MFTSHDELGDDLFTIATITTEVFESWMQDQTSLAQSIQSLGQRRARISKAAILS